MSLNDALDKAFGKSEVESKKPAPVPKTPRPTPIQKRQYTPQPKLNYRVLLTTVNNYLMGYRKAYERNQDNPLSEIKLKYEEVQKQKNILEKLL